MNPTNYDIYISYSGRKTFKTCPKQYEYKYILKDPTSSFSKESLFGSTIGEIYELFYENKLWDTKDPVSSVMNLIEPTLNRICLKNKFDINSDPGFHFILKNELKHYVPIGVDLIRQNNLLTTFSRAEVDLSVVFFHKKHDLTVKLGGRADFIHSNDRKNVTIIDGKGSKYREKYADADQLIWYAVQHYIKWRVAPTRLGFLFYRFPDDPMKWVSYNADSIRSSLDETFSISKKIKFGEFNATPSRECTFCPYKEKCDDGMKFIASDKSKSKTISNSMFDLETF